MIPPVAPPGDMRNPDTRALELRKDPCEYPGCAKHVCYRDCCICPTWDEMNLEHCHFHIQFYRLPRRACPPVWADWIREREHRRRKETMALGPRGSQERWEPTPYRGSRLRIVEAVPQ